MNATRLYFIDLARAAAAIFMVFVHVQGLLSQTDVQKTLYGSIVSILGEAPAAPVFMFAMGVSFVLSNKLSVMDRVKRGAKILLKGYQLNILRLLVPFVLFLLLLLLGLVTPEVGKEESFKSELLNNVLVIDILQFAGLAYLFMTLLSYLNLITPKVIIGLILLTVGVSPLLWGIDTGNVIFNRILDPLWGNSGEYVSFPFFPWIAFPLLGLLCGEVYTRSNEISRVLKKQMLIGSIVLLCGVGVTLTDTSFHMGDYWRTGPGGMLIYLGFIPVWIYVIEKVSMRLKGKLFDIVLFISKNITVFYVTQWLLISSSVVIFGQNKSNMVVTIILEIAITIASFFLTKWRITYKTRKSIKVMPVILLICLPQLACSSKTGYPSDKLTVMKSKEISLIEKDKKLSLSEKEEGIATVNSIFSFASEIAQTKDDYYSPYVVEWISPNRKFAGDNPDAQYFSFFIDPQASYEIDVKHDNVFFMEITSYKRENNQNKISNSYVVPLSESKVIMSVNEQLNPQITLSKTDYIVMIRYYKSEAKKKMPKPTVRCIQLPHEKKNVDQNFRANLAVSLFDALYQSSVLLTTQMEKQVNNYLDDLDMDNPYVKNLYPCKSNIYNGVFIRIPKGKYLSVKGKLDKSKYTIFVFYNRWWATPFKGGNKCSLNTQNLKTDKKGNYEILIMNEDRKLPNSLVINNLEEGILSIRSILEEVEEPLLELKSF